MLPPGNLRPTETPTEETPSFTTGRMSFRRYEPLSLTDAIVIAAMQRKETDYLYSFDDGFDSVSFITRLTTPANPFEQ